MPIFLIPLKVKFSTGEWANLRFAPFNRVRSQGQTYTKFIANIPNFGDFSSHKPIFLHPERWKFLRESRPMVRSVLQKKPEAQLSQRDRATFRVIEYFAKSLKVTQSHSKWHCCVCKSVLVFHWNYVCMSYRLWYIQRQRMAWPWNWG